MDTTGVITTVAGGGHTPLARGSLALSTSIEPGPLAVDVNGNIYFANVYIIGSPMVPTIYKIDSTGLINPYAGGSGKDGDSGPALSIPIGYAYCIIIDTSGNLYICDSAYNRLRKVTLNGIMSTVAGNGNSANGPIQAGPPNATAIGSPTSVALDSKGDLFIYSMRQVTEIDATGMLQPVAGIGSTAINLHRRRRLRFAGNLRRRRRDGRRSVWRRRPLRWRN